VLKTSELANNHNFKIAVFGMGYVGLPTAVGFAELGWNVIGADTEVSKLELIKSGNSPFYERGLEELVRKHLDSGRFEITSDVAEAIRTASVLFICVGTPQAENGEADLRQVEALARTIAANMNGYKLIVEKSTVPAVTGQWVRRTIERELAARALASSGNGSHGSANGGSANGGEHHPAAPQATASRAITFDVASNPEFLQEGKAVQDFFHPDRIVCGVSSGKARQLLSELYRGIDCPIVFTDLNTAELIKHAANAFLAMKVSFINLIADVCEAVNADVTQVARGIGLDSRIGPAFLNAGLGYGGYCLPKDLQAFIHLAGQHNVDASLLLATQAINSSRVDRVIKKVHDALWIVHGKTIAVLGLAFKPATDDVRESQSLRTVEALLRNGAKVRLHDPEAMRSAKQVVPEDTRDVTYCETAYEAVKGADALLLLTEWEQFKSLDFQSIREHMRVPLVIDARNMYDAAEMRARGFEYVCMGRSHGADAPLRRIASTRTRRARGERSLGAKTGKTDAGQQAIARVLGVDAIMPPGA